MQYDKDRAEKRAQDCVKRIPVAFYASSEFDSRNGVQASLEGRDFTLQGEQMESRRLVTARLEESNPVRDAETPGHRHSVPQIKKGENPMTKEQYEASMAQLNSLQLQNEAAFAEIERLTIKAKRTAMQMETILSEINKYETESADHKVSGRHFEDYDIRNKCNDHCLHPAVNLPKVNDAYQTYCCHCGTVRV